jgi:hypothetical protein
MFVFLQEVRFNPDRLLEIAKAQFPNISRERRQEMAANCIVYTLKTTEELSRTLQSLEEVLALSFSSHEPLYPYSMFSSFLSFFFELLILLAEGCTFIAEDLSCHC